MNDEMNGDAAADKRIEARLARHFEVELTRARRDFPTLGSSRAGSGASSRGHGRVWPRLALPVVACAVVIAAAVTWASFGTQPRGPQGGAPSGAGAVTPDSSGIPTSIDGEAVLSIAGRATWPIDRSFLLGGFPVFYAPPCPAPIAPTPEPSPEADLLNGCGGITLLASLNATDLTRESQTVAPKSGSLLEALLGGPPVVVRVHTHDSEAALCGTATSFACDSQVVVEAVVWIGGPWPSGASVTNTFTVQVNPVASPPIGPLGPATPTPAVNEFSADGVPTVIAGEKVYRATNMPPTGDFLLGGVLTGYAAPSCPSTGPSGDSCGASATIDGFTLRAQIALSGSLVDTVVVARVARSKVLAVCISTPCKPIEILVITEIVWNGPPSPQALPTSR